TESRRVAEALMGPSSPSPRTVRGRCASRRLRTTLAASQLPEGGEMSDGQGASEREREVLLQDEQTFPPPPEFAAQANISDPAVYEQADADLQGWWESWAQKLDWAEPWSRVLDWSPPWAKWFVDGKLNA